ncbi:bifunctional diaminohydroxyphosphoribosylaminopyrimidine deaminase/5-amino-6-(5-phosphoribosylamino)uracil reductase [Cochleicola gelatinilyticus]|uniref:Riboflavin biosynthesis protein RibD n=2 Tax=Cochleicola gelatinilyticus TaxID=1763537 RepID=A0A167HE38_9FLAO|nr:bifunctional diaminohydroxyphosphoribosylaminopyrimidine deaminase/5-amino-6-(5-phosphoribosylamino)uracil reductase [Cochleicola gelatinilyticus]
MLRCIQLAKNGLPEAMPNPSVGALLVHNGQIISEGFTSAYGGPHAEVNAIKNLSNTSLLLEATLYVTLEPCSHFGKTPPCADLIIASGIKKVVIGGTDPNPKVAGNGIKKLIEAGCDVIVGVLAEACEAVNKRFYTFHTQKRPFITLKWAETKDHFIAPLSKNRGIAKEPFWITNRFSRQHAHKMRAMEQAILVGTQTVLQDNPSLTTRDWHGTSPIRVILDRTLKIPKDAAIYDSNAPTLIITEQKREAVQNITFETIVFSETLAKQICAIAYKHNIQSILIEGGAKMLQTFIDENLWDEAFVFTGATQFKTGISAPLLSEELVSETILKDDLLTYYKNQTN